MTEKKMKMTVVVPVRNRAHVVCRTLDSIKNQSWRPIELIIADNGSDDPTPDVVSKWADENNSEDFIIRIVNEPVCGASRARNRGLREVTTEHVMFFDSDDEMEFDHIERICTILGNHPEIDLLHWSLSTRDADGWTSVCQSANPDDLLTEHILHSTLSTARYTVRTEILRQAGAWDESLSTWDDYELGVRLLTMEPPLRVRHLSGAPRVIANLSEDTQTGSSYSCRAEAQTLALEAIGKDLAEDPCHRLILNGKKAVIAANYRNEGSQDLAATLLQQTKADTQKKHHLKLQIIHTFQRLFHKGGSWLTHQLLQPKGNRENG